MFYIATDGGGVPIGQVRFEVSAEEAVVSICLDEAWRGEGYGTEVLRLATERVFGRSSVRVIHAYVKEDNRASIRAFLKAGFVERGFTRVQGQRAVHLVLERDRSA